MTTAQNAEDPIKLILLGETGAGKSGAITPLAVAGYKIRYLDLDNGLPIIRGFLTDPESHYFKQNPNAMKNIAYETLTARKKKYGKGMLGSADSKVWTTLVSLLDHWKVEDPANPANSYDLGRVDEWGPDTILVIDTLTSVAAAALDFHLSLQGALGEDRDGFKGQKDIGVAQKLTQQFLEKIQDTGVRCHVIVLAHLVKVSESGFGPRSEQAKDEEIKTHPNAIGRALSPLILRHFNTALQVVVSPTGKRQILTQTKGDVALKTTIPLKLPVFLPLETGLADLFKAIRGK